MREICEKLAQMSGKHELLEYTLLLAAQTASSVEDKRLESRLRAGVRNKTARFGVWDWDVSTDRNFCDPVIAEMFGVDARMAAKGLPNSEYLAAMHPDDLPSFAQAIAQTVSKGGQFEARYRLRTNNQTTWVLARGHCYLDDSGRPMRFPGAVIDISEDFRLIR